MCFVTLYKNSWVKLEWKAAKVIDQTIEKFLDVGNTYPIYLETHITTSFMKTFYYQQLRIVETIGEAKLRSHKKIVQWDLEHIITPQNDFDFQIKDNSVVDGIALIKILFPVSNTL